MFRSVTPSADREANGFFSVQRAESVKFFRTTGSPAAANSAEPAIRAVTICLVMACSPCSMVKLGFLLKYSPDCEMRAFSAQIFRFADEWLDN